jgi:hypothetical protein
LKSAKGKECKYSIICTEREDGTWELRYREPLKDTKIGIVINYCEHNHPPSSGTGSEHAIQRRLQRQGERSMAIIEQHNTGSKTRHIQEFLDTKYKDQNVLYNYLKAIVLSLSDI